MTPDGTALVWLALCGGLLSLDRSAFGQFMLAQSLVAGWLLGAMVGDPVTGALAGSLVQLLWIGFLPVGAFVPPDHSLTGGITSVLTIVLQKKFGWGFEPSFALALLAAIPAGLLSGQVDSGIRNFNNGWNARVEAWLAQGKLGLAEYANVWGLILVFFRGFLFYLVWLGPVRQALVGLLPGLPVGAWRGLGWGFWIVPAMGFAALLEIAAKDHLWPWILGVATLSAAGVWFFAPQGLPWILSGALLLGVATAWRKKPW